MAIVVYFVDWAFMHCEWQSKGKQEGFLQNLKNGISYGFFDGIGVFYLYISGLPAEPHDSVLH